MLSSNSKNSKSLLQGDSPNSIIAISNFDDVKYEAYNFKDGELANENKLKEKADYAAYKEATPGAMPKFKFNGALIRDFKEVLMPEILLLLV